MDSSRDYEQSYYAMQRQRADQVRNQLLSELQAEVENLPRGNPGKMQSGEFTVWECTDGNYLCRQDVLDLIQRPKGDK